MQEQDKIVKQRTASKDKQGNRIEPDVMYNGSYLEDVPSDQMAPLTDI